MGPTRGLLPRLVNGFQVAAGDNVVFYKFLIDDGGPKDAYAIATNCLRAWENFPT